MKVKNIRKVIQREIAAILAEQEEKKADPKLPDTAPGFQFKIHKDLNKVKKGLKPKTKKRFERIAKRGPVIKVTNYMWGKDAKWGLAGRRSYDILLQRIKDSNVEISDVLDALKKLAAGEKLIMSGDPNVDKLFSKAMKGDPFQYEIQLVDNVKVDPDGAPDNAPTPGKVLIDATPDTGQADRPKATLAVAKPEKKKESCPPPTSILRQLDAYAEQRERRSVPGARLGVEKLKKLVRAMQAYLKSCKDDDSYVKYRQVLFDRIDDESDKAPFTPAERGDIVEIYMSMLRIVDQEHAKRP